MYKCICFFICFCALFVWLLPSPEKVILSGWCFKWFFLVYIMFGLFFKCCLPTLSLRYLFVYLPYLFCFLIISFIFCCFLWQSWVGNGHDSLCFWSGKKHLAKNVENPCFIIVKSRALLKSIKAVLFNFWNCVRDFFTFLLADCCWEMWLLILRSNWAFCMISICQANHHICKSSSFTTINVFPPWFVQQLCFHVVCFKCVIAYLRKCWAQRMRGVCWMRQGCS